MFKCNKLCLHLYLSWDFACNRHFPVCELAYCISSCAYICGVCVSTVRSLMASLTSVQCILVHHWKVHISWTTRYACCWTLVIMCCLYHTQNICTFWNILSSMWWREGGMPSFYKEAECYHDHVLSSPLVDWKSNVGSLASRRRATVCPGQLWGAGQAGWFVMRSKCNEN